jgi:hypothetical protein
MNFLFVYRCAYRIPLSQTIRIKETMTTTTTTEIKTDNTESEKMEMCPICMDDLPLPSASNRVTTECGHTFHTSCLMASVAHGKYSCPCCRAEMAEEPEEDEDSEDEDEEYLYHLRRRERERQRLRNIDIGFQGMRLMFQREAGEELEEKDEDDIEDEMEAFAIAEIAAGRSGEPEDAIEHGGNPDDDEDEEAEIIKPSVEYLATALLTQGITMHDMVKIMLLEHEEYEEDDEDNMEVSDDIFGKLRILISNYQPAPADVAAARFVPLTGLTPLAGLITAGLGTSEELLEDSLEDVFARIDKRLKMEKNERGLMEKEDRPIM